MNKAFLLLASVTLGTAAFAQTTMAPPPSGSTTAPDAGMAPPTATPDASTPMQTPPATDSATPPATPDAAMPAPAPMADAPAPMSTPDASAAPAPAAMPMASAGTTDYPTCSRSVTDKCVQKGAMRMHKKRG